MFDLCKGVCSVDIRFIPENKIRQIVIDQSKSMDTSPTKHPKCSNLKVYIVSRQLWTKYLVCQNNVANMTGLKNHRPPNFIPNY